MKVRRLRSARRTVADGIRFYERQETMPKFIVESDASIVTPLMLRTFWAGKKVSPPINKVHGRLHLKCLA